MQLVRRATTVPPAFGLVVTLDAARNVMSPTTSEIRKGRTQSRIRNVAVDKSSHQNASDILGFGKLFQNRQYCKHLMEYDGKESFNMGRRKDLNHGQSKR